MTPEKQSLIGFNPTVQIGDGPLIPIIGARVEMYEAGTGAVRSTDLKLERWDLLSGAAFRQLVPEMENICPGGETVRELVNEAADCMWRFLGNCTQTGGDRISHLTRGWAWLAAAMEVEAGVEYLKVPRYPLILATPDREGVPRGVRQVRRGELAQRLPPQDPLQPRPEAHGPVHQQRDRGRRAGPRELGVHGESAHAPLPPRHVRPAPRARLHDHRRAADLPQVAPLEEADRWLRTCCTITGTSWR